MDNSTSDLPRACDLVFPHQGSCSSSDRNIIVLDVGRADLGPSSGIAPVDKLDEGEWVLLSGHNPTLRARILFQTFVLGLVCEPDEESFVRAAQPSGENVGDKEKKK
jgi:hypothetical protein